MKRILAALCVVLFAVSLLSSVPVTWHWATDDEAVNYFRYRLDSSEWVVTDNTVTSFVYEEGEPGVDYTLYLEASYDGRNWSETAEKCISVPLNVPEKPEPPEISVISVEQHLEDGSDAQVKEPAASNGPATDIGDSFSWPTFELGLKGGTSLYIDPKGQAPVDFRLSSALSFDFPSILEAGEHVAFGLRLGVDADFYNADSDSTLLNNLGAFFTEFDTSLFMSDNYAYALNFTLIPTMDLRFGFFGMKLGLGGGYGMILGDNYNEYRSNEFYQLKMDGFKNHFGFFAEALLGTRFYMGDVFSLGFDLSGRMSICSLKFYEDPVFDADLSLVMGFAF